VIEPLLLVDVDGTLNPSKTCYSSLSWAEYVLDGKTVSLCMEHGSWLDSLDDKFEAVWCTAWEEKANEFIGSTLMLPEWDYVRMLSPGGGPRLNSEFMPTPKLIEVIDYVGDRPFVWVDDRFNTDAHAWVDMRNLEIPSLLIEVDPEVGMTKADFQLIEDFHDYLYGDD